MKYFSFFTVFIATCFVAISVSAVTKHAVFPSAAALQPMPFQAYPNISNNVQFHGDVARVEEHSSGNGIESSTTVVTTTDDHSVSPFRALLYAFVVIGMFIVGSSVIIRRTDPERDAPSHS